MTPPFYNPTSGERDLQFLYTLANTCGYLSHSLQPSSGCEVVSHCGVNGISPRLIILSHFSCACWPFVSLLGRNVYSDPLPVFKLDYLSFLFSWDSWKPQFFYSEQHIYDPRSRNWALGLTLDSNNRWTWERRGARSPGAHLPPCSQWHWTYSHFNHF